MVSKIRELNDAELEVVSGGIDCKTALFVATVDILTANALLGLGGVVNAGTASKFAGHAKGVVDGACGPA